MWVVFVAVFIIIWIVAAANKSTSQQQQQLNAFTTNSAYQGGVRALGILLQVSPNTWGAGYRTQSRSVRIDVEVPGQPPYEIGATLTYPTNLAADIVPGASLEVLVDPNDQTTIQVVGPGTGFAVARVA